MKRVYVMAAVATAVIAMAGSAFAGSTSINNPIALTAQVKGVCQEVQPATFNLMDIDTATLADLAFAPAQDEQVKCTKNQSFTINVASTQGGGSGACSNTGYSTNMALKSGADAIPYTVACTLADGTGAFTGQGGSTPLSLGLGIKVLKADAVAAAAHLDYADTLTLTITY